MYDYKKQVIIKVFVLQLILLFFTDCKQCLSLKGDVYPVEQTDDYTFNQVLDASWGVLNEEDVRTYFHFVFFQSSKAWKLFQQYLDITKQFVFDASRQLGFGHTLYQWL